MLCTGRSSVPSPRPWTARSKAPPEAVHRQFEGAAREAQDAVSSCMEDAGNDAARLACIKGSSRRGLSSSPVVKAIAESRGKAVADVKLDEVRSYLKKGAKAEIGDAMEGCVAAAADKAGRAACTATSSAR